MSVFFSLGRKHEYFIFRFLFCTSFPQPSVLGVAALRDSLEPGLAGGRIVTLNSDPLLPFTPISVLPSNLCQPALTAV